MKLLALAAILPALALSQPRRVAYEAASIKPAAPADRRRPTMEFLPGGRFRAVNVPLFQVLATAYRCPWQSLEALASCMKGIPDWMFTQPHDLEARAEAPLSSTAPAQSRNERIRLMLQAVLADRLKLQLRRETAEVSGYALVVVPSGIRLRKADTTEQACAESVPFGPVGGAAPGCHQIQGGVGRGMHSSAANMADVALFLSNWSDRPIVDSTGLSGLYAFDTEGWSPSPADPSRQSLEEVLDRIGLKLVGRKVKIETLKIDHIEKPSAN